MENVLSEYLQQRKQTIYTVINIQNIDKDTRKIIPHETQSHQHSNFITNSPIQSPITLHRFTSVHYTPAPIQNGTKTYVRTHIS